MAGRAITGAALIGVGLTGAFLSITGRLPSALLALTTDDSRVIANQGSPGQAPPSTPETTSELPAYRDPFQQTPTQA